MIWHIILFILKTENIEYIKIINKFYCKICQQNFNIKNSQIQLCLKNLLFLYC